jgi:HEAT repeat protein
VRYAAVSALRSLGDVSETAVARLATALAREPDAVVRAAIVGAVEAIAPGTTPVLEAHVNALRDPDPAVRRAGATFKKVQGADSLVSALVKALGDPSDDVRGKVASSLTEILFETSAVAPALLNALRENTQRDAVVEALRQHLETTTASADLSRVRIATLGAVVHALKNALSLDDADIRSVIYALVGRIVSFASLTRDQNLHEAIETVIPMYLKGLDESDPMIREQVLDRLGATSIRQPAIVSALNRFIERSDLPEDERKQALVARTTQASPAGSAEAAGASGPPAGSRMRPAG